MALRILLVDSGREWRGGQRQVLLLAEGLRDDGFEPLVVVSPASPLAQRLRARGLAVSAIRMRGTWDLAAARRVRALVRTWRPDVVHVHDARAYAVVLAALVRRPEIPLVVTRRLAHAPRGLGVTYGRRVTRFIAATLPARDVLVGLGVEPERIDVVHVGLPPPVVERPRDWRAECRWPADAVLCGVVAGVGGPSTEMLEAIAEHLAPRARERARLLVLGGSGSGSGAGVVGRVEAFGAGFVDDVHAAIAGLDVLWHLGGEGLGTAVIEGMALGVPSVAFAVGAIPEIVLHGRTGLLAPVGDAPAFADSARRLIEDDALRRRLGAAGPARAREFDARRMVEMTEQVYRAVLSAPVAP